MDNFKVLEGNYFDIENSFYLRSGTDRFAKFLSHYEIYKEIVSLPGDLLELGVFKGASLVRWASFRHFLENEHARKIFGFDPFGSFPIEQVDQQDGLAFAQEHDHGSGIGISKDNLEDIFKQKNIGNLSLVKGDVFDTLPSFLETNPHLKISLLHLDMDIYEPTKFALEQLWDRIVPNGKLVVDDYHTVAGATQAIDEFFSTTKYSRYEKAKFGNVPTIFTK